MASWEDVQRLALALPLTDERVSRERRQWRVDDKLFVWERPLRGKEVAELGDDAPDGPILGARVEHLGAKQAVLEDDPSVYFTTSHFTGSAAVLVRLERIGLDELEEVITEAWLARAQRRSVEAFLAKRADSGSD
jgi:hypothetical protein